MQQFAFFRFMLDHQELTIPVYFLRYSEEFEKLIADISHNQASTSVTSALNDIVDKISANIYQVVVSGPNASPKKDSKISILQGELLPFKPAVSHHKEESGQNKLPVIVMNVGFKHFGIANIETPAFDTTVFLTLIDAFSKLYNQMSSAKYKLGKFIQCYQNCAHYNELKRRLSLAVFVLHEGSPLLNYVGLKKWIDVATEDTHIQNADFALCIDSMISPNSDETIYLQVSKPPKEGSSIEKFWKILEKKAVKAGRKVEINHQKINLQQPFNKWPHERFSLKRMTSMTLSTVKDHNSPLRTTIFTSNSPSSSVLESDSELDEKILNNLVTNTKILVRQNIACLEIFFLIVIWLQAESLASYIFSNTDDDEEIFIEPLTITQQSLNPYIAPKSLSRSNNVKMTFDKFLKNVKVIVEKADQREPEFMFYDGDEATLSVHKWDFIYFKMLKQWD